MKLPVFATLQEALQMVMAHRRDLLRVGMVFIIGFFALGIVFLRYLLPMFPTISESGAIAQSAVDPRLPGAVLITLVIEFLLITVFTVGWHRAVLIGPERGQGAQLGWREIRFFGRLWLCYIIAFIAILFVATVEQFIGLMLHADPQAMTWGAVFSCLLVIAYIFARVGPSFAALSIDNPMGIVASWVATRGNGLPILLAHILALAGGVAVDFVVGWFLSLFGLGELAPYTVLLIGDLISCVLIAVIVSINAIVFRRLTGWQAAVKTAA